ncbi:MAG: hypothetical protein LBV09_05035 [Deferribacteraceae bacterium]|jgi:hypothetical protein|nr:hypothetical protein [Deferribacteraceae bacterium]
MSISAYAQHSVTAGYKYYDAKKDYSNEQLQYEANLSGHVIFLGYERTDGRSNYDMRSRDDNGYDPLQRAGVGYYYFGEQHVWGAFLSSSSDRIFNSMDVTTMIGFYGYNIYSRELGVTKYPMPDGSVYEKKRRTAFYLGVGAASEPIVFGGYFLPVFSYVYEGEWYTLNLGLPITAIAFYPSHKHLITFKAGFQGNGELSYEYKITPRNIIRFDYVAMADDYRLSDETEASYGGARTQITYLQEWYRLTYTHKISAFEISGSFGYMPLGYYFKGKYFHRAPSREIEATTELGISIRGTF